MESTMTDKKEKAEKRRKILKSIAAGSGAVIVGKSLPESWVRPTVESVVLPAHGQTSFYNGNYSGTAYASLDRDTMFAKAMDLFLPTAKAGGIVENDVRIDWCINPELEPGVDDHANFVYILLQDAISDPPCWAELWEAGRVPADGNPHMLRMSGPACSNLVSVNWMEKLGLVNEAHASEPVVELTLNGIQPGDTFRLTHTFRSIDITEPMSPGECGPKSVECGDPRSCDD
jgi:hypothetical protein